MQAVAPGREPLVVRQVFPTWWIAVPDTFADTFVAEGDYWHAWDDHRSVSLTSIVLTDRRGRPVKARRILRRLPAIPGEPIALPVGLIGRAGIIDQEPPARAARAISGILVVDGRALITTVTADDLGWAEAVWLSIRARPP